MLKVHKPFEIRAKDVVLNRVRPGHTQNHALNLAESPGIQSLNKGVDAVNVVQPKGVETHHQHSGLSIDLSAGVGAGEEVR